MECLFCQIAQHQIPAKIEYEDDEIIAFADIAPKAPVHILIVPKKHIKSVKDVTEEDVNLIGQLIEKAADIAREKEIAETGFRLIFNSGKDSGQEMDHLHLHLLGGKNLGPMIQQ